VDDLVLEGADQLEAGAVADVDEPAVRVAAECPLRHPAVGGAVEDAAPALELAHAVRRLPCVQLRHPPVVQVLAAEHRVLEVRAPVVLGCDVAERRGDAALRHHGVRLSEEGLAHDGRPGARRAGLDRGAEAGASGSDDDDVVVVRDGGGGVGRGHQKNRGSSITPIEQRRT
jgi:hypothetical protein